MNAPTQQLPTDSNITRLSLASTLKRGLRASWDALGLTCAGSLTLFVTSAIAFSVGTGLRSLLVSAPPLVAFMIQSGVIAGLSAPVYVGIAGLAHRILTHDEPSYACLWTYAKCVFLRSVTVALIQLAVIWVVLANVLFYWNLGGFGWQLTAIACCYVLLFWAMTCVYHWPLLIAGQEGLIVRDDGGPARISAIFRNAALMTTTAPVYTLALLLFLAFIGVVCAASGVGMALLFPGLAALLTTQASRDQLVRFAILPPGTNPDEEVPEDVWRLK